jgi:hypothetical protein
MPKNYYTYMDDEGNAYSFLQDTTIATAMGNGAAGAEQPLITGSRHLFRPRKTWVKLATGRYVGYVNGNQDFSGIAQGDTVLGDAVVVGKVGEKHYSTRKGF